MNRRAFWIASGSAGRERRGKTEVRAASTTAAWARPRARGEPMSSSPARSRRHDRGAQAHLPDQRARSAIQREATRARFTRRASSIVRAPASILRARVIEPVREPALDIAGRPVRSGPRSPEPPPDRG